MESKMKHKLVPLKFSLDIYFDVWSIFQWFHSVSQRKLCCLSCLNHGYWTSAEAAELPTHISSPIRIHVLVPLAFIIFQNMDSLSLSQTIIQIDYFADFGVQDSRCISLTQNLLAFTINKACVHFFCTYCSCNRGLKGGVSTGFVLLLRWSHWLSPFGKWLSTNLLTKVVARLTLNKRKNYQEKYKFSLE